MRGGGGCTLHASPGGGWESVFDQVGVGQDAHICLEVGQYLLQDVVQIIGKGHLELVGQGRGTHIIAPSTESALQFIRCAGVTVRELRITAGTAPNLRWRPGRNGTVECRDCGPVTIESVWARCNGARPRSTACIAVGRYQRSASQTLGRGDVVVRDCTLVVGLQQIGLNVVNARRARVVGNSIHPEALRPSQVWATIAGTRLLRREVADLLVAHRRPSAAAPHPNENDLTITGRWRSRTFTLDDHTLQAVVDPDVGSRIETYLREAGPAGIQRAGDLSTHLRNVLMTAVKTGGTIDALRRRPDAAGNRNLNFDLLSPWIRGVRRSMRSHASQGIVVGGREASLVEIHENEITRAIQGIHVGLSHDGQRPGQRDIARRVSIVGNTVDLAVIPVARARHGIFCGNFHSLLVQHNFVSKSLDSAALRSLPVNGVYVRGHAGSFMQVKDNDIRDCATGVHFEPDPTTRKAPQWLIEDNLLQSATRLVHVPVDPALRAKVTTINNRSG
jgi:hypothetical protein